MGDPVQRDHDVRPAEDRRHLPAPASLRRGAGDRRSRDPRQRGLPLRRADARRPARSGVAARRRPTVPGGGGCVGQRCPRQALACASRPQADAQDSGNGGQQRPRPRRGRCPSDGRLETGQRWTRGSLGGRSELQGTREQARTGFPRSPCRLPIARPGGRRSPRVPPPSPVPRRGRAPQSTARKRSRPGRAHAQRTPIEGTPEPASASPLPLKLREPPARRREAPSRSVGRAQDHPPGTRSGKARGMTLPAH